MHSLLRLAQTAPPAPLALVRYLSILIPRDMLQYNNIITF